MSKKQDIQKDLIEVGDLQAKSDAMRKALDSLEGERKGVQHYLESELENIKLKNENYKLNRALRIMFNGLDLHDKWENRVAAAKEVLEG